MKNKSLLSLLGLFILTNVALINKNVEANDDAYITPTTILNKKINYVDIVEFNPGSVDRVFNDDWAKETIAYSYGYTTRDNESAYFIQGGGGNYSIKWKAYNLTKNTADVSSSDGFMMYLDTSKIVIEEGIDKISAGVKLYLSNKTFPGWFDLGMYEDAQSGSDAIYQSYHIMDNSKGYYYDMNNDSWIETIGSNKCLDLPLSYKGYIYIPFESMNWLGEVSTSDKDYSLKSHGFGRNYKYFNAIDFITNNLGTCDSQNSIIIDDLSFVSLGEEHTHSYQLLKTKTASCNTEGYDLYQCNTCLQYKKENVKRLEHEFSSYVTEDNVVAVSKCKNCNELHQSEDENILSKALKVDEDNYITYTFHYGLDCSKQRKIKLIKNSYLNKEPYMKDEIGQWDEIYTFFAWSKNKEVFEALNPNTLLATEDKDFYADYVISSYDNTKYSAMLSDVSWSGGIYNAPKGKAVFIGASNSSLYHNLEGDMAKTQNGHAGIPSINNSVAGGSSYNFLHYINPLIIGFKPKLVVYGLSSNDWAYWSSKEKDIFNNVKTFVEMVHEALPGTVVAIVHGNLLPGRIELEQTVNRMNDMVKKYCESTDYLEFIDYTDYAYEAMLNYPIGWDTWTHFNQEKYHEWYSLIKEDLLSIIDDYGIRF